MSVMKDMQLHNAEQLGATIRLKRKEKGLSQTALAERLGVERKWVLRLEAGNPKAELGLVLRALKALDMRATLGDERQPLPLDAPSRPARSQLDEVFQRLQRSSRK